MGVEQPLFLHEDVLPAIPSGWHWSRSDSLVVQLKPGKLFDTKTVASTGAVPVLNQSESGVLGYHDEEPGVVASTGAPVVTFANHTCAMRLVKHPFSAIQNIFPKVGKQGVCDTVWFYYALLGRVRTNEYKGHHPLFRDAFVPVPPLAVQRRIASILSAYDYLIENNTRRIAILEEMARRIYEEWFVHLRFPGHERTRMVESELGLVPEGWAINRLDELAEIKGGKQLEKEEIQSVGTYPVFGGNGIQGFSSRATHAGFVIAFGRVGAYCGAIHWALNGAWLNNNSSSVVPNGCDALVLQHLVGFDFGPLRGGAAQPFISNGALSGIKLLMPTTGVAEQFCRLVGAMRQLQDTLTRSNRNLRTTRNLLLPKLISGELDVSAIAELEAVAA